MTAEFQLERVYDAHAQALLGFLLKKMNGDFASYCRMVDARRLSNGKVKADNNQK